MFTVIWTPALLGDCPHWQPAIAVIIMQFVTYVYLVNKLSLSLF